MQLFVLFFTLLAWNVAAAKQAKQNNLAASSRVNERTSLFSRSSKGMLSQDDGDTYYYNWGCPATWASSPYDLHPNDLLTVNITAECDIGYLYVWVFDQNWRTVFYNYIYATTEEKLDSISCQPQPDDLTNGILHYYLNWYSKDWYHGGYTYDYNEFLVTDGVNPDYDSPYMEDTFVDPFYAVVDVSLSTPNSFAVYVSAREPNNGFQSGVDQISIQAYDARFSPKNIYYI